MIGVALFGGKMKMVINVLLNGVRLQKVQTILSLPKKISCFNYRVENLIELLEALKKEGVTVIDKVEEFEYGKFGWIVDLDGNKIELWEPKDAAFL